MLDSSEQFVDDTWVFGVGSSLFARLLVGVAAASLIACGGRASRPAAAVSPAPPVAEAAWSGTSFETKLLARLHKQFPHASITSLGERTYRVHTGKQHDLQVRFEKAYDDCKADWSSCEGSVAHEIGALGEALNEAPITKDQLRVVLRSVAKIAAVKGAKPDVVVRPFSSDAQWLLAADLPNTIRLTLVPGEMGLSRDESWSIGLDNMRRSLTAKVPATGTSAELMVYLDDYAPSALLFPDLLEKAVHDTFPARTGRLLAVCPEDNIVLYTLGGPNEISALGRIAAKGKDSASPLSAKVMEWDGNSWHEMN